MIPNDNLRNAIGIRAIATIGAPHGEGWYDDARAQIARVCDLGGFDRPTFTGVLAVTSPRCTVKRNIRLTLHRLINGVLPVGTMRRIVSATENCINGGAISGPKVSAFYDCLMGDDDCIVWDTHMIDAFGVPPTRFNQTARAECERILRTVSRGMGLTPCQGQAAVWCGWRSIRGYNPVDFPVYSEYLKFVADTDSDGDTPLPVE